MLPQQLGGGEVVRAGANVRQAVRHHLLGAGGRDLIERQRFAERRQAGGGPFAIEEPNPHASRVRRRDDGSLLRHRSPNPVADVPQRGG